VAKRDNRWTISAPYNAYVSEWNSWQAKEQLQA
jgi:hypothetical protein